MPGQLSDALSPSPTSATSLPSCLGFGTGLALSADAWEKARVGDLVKEKKLDNLFSPKEPRPREGRSRDAPSACLGRAVPQFPPMGAELHSSSGLPFPQLKGV